MGGGKKSNYCFLVYVTVWGSYQGTGMLLMYELHSCLCSVRTFGIKNEIGI